MLSAILINPARKTLGFSRRDIRAAPCGCNERTGQEVSHVSHCGYVPPVGLRRSP